MKEKIKEILMNFIRHILKVFFVFPIKKERIMFDSYLGSQYSCNPKYIFLELLKQQEPYEIIWSFKKPSKFTYLQSENVKLVKAYSIRFWYYRLTAKVTVTNVIWKNFTPVRKGQYEIQTWHGGGGGYKKTLADDKEQQKKVITLKRHLKNFERYSLVLTSSATSLRTNARMAMQYTGVVLGGTPRNDMFIKQKQSELNNQVREAFHLKENIKIALYAPTWRSGATKADFDVDFKLLRSSLIERFGGEWVILRRMHWMAVHFFSEVTDEYIPAENYSDMQELLYAADILLTDYSSSIWDFSFTKKPCFLICFDLEKYREDRDFYNPIQTWGFPVAESNEQLRSNILNFDPLDYSTKMDEQHEKNHSFESGNSAQNVCAIIHSQCFGDGSLPSNLPLYLYEDEKNKAN